MNEEEVQSSSERNLMKEFFNEIFDLEYGLWKTFLTLFTHPELVVNAYLIEDKKRFYPPFKYVILTVTIMTFIFFGAVDFEQITVDQIEQPSAGYDFTEQQQEILDAFSANYTLVMLRVSKQFVTLTTLLIWLPSLAIVSFWFFRKRYKQFSHHLLFVAYFFGQASIINTILLLPLYFIDLGNSYILMTDIIKNIYVVYAFYRLMYDKTAGSVVRSVVVPFLSTFLYTVIISIVVFISSFILTYRQGVFE